MIQPSKSIYNFRGTFLSNFWPCKIVYDGIEYPSAEHAYVAAKIIDPKVRRHISKIPSPSRAKQFGRQLILRDDWEEVRIDCMREILDLKFAIPELMNMLNATAPSQLVELNDWGDVFWGAQLENGEIVGENWLGRLLMEIRDS